MKIPKIRSILKFLLGSAILGLITTLLLIVGIYFYLKPELPSMEALKDVRFQIPLRVYSRDEQLIAEFGEQRRTPVKFGDVPDAFIKAVMAAEDQNFFKHSGVDIKALTRAVKLMIQNRGSIRGGGGSTITMQLTRALFLNKDRKFKRKFKEIILTVQLEQKLSKEEILELYFNEIYLGKRAYGIQAAANVYYDKNINELSLAQLAMIAGLPKAPATNNPVNNPERAIQRRNWILGRMLALNFISPQQHAEATAEALSAKDHGQANELEAPFIAEMIRNDLFEQYGEEIYTGGYKAYASIESGAQSFANKAVFDGIHQYVERHGYKGAIQNVRTPELASIKDSFFAQNADQKQQAAAKIKNLLADDQEQTVIDDRYNFSLLRNLVEQSGIDTKELFKDLGNSNTLRSALVLFIDQELNTALLLLNNSKVAVLEPENALWAAPFIDRNTVGELPTTIGDVLKMGDLIFIRELENEQWRLAQKPEVQSAFVALDPNDGAILALVGGYNYYGSKYNRVTQGGRQAGSSFKPFIYTKALESGYTAATIINDAPVVFEDAALEETWRPENSGGKFYGPTRFRQALYRSRNLVSIRILRKIRVPETIDSMSRFGFEKSQLPANLSLSLGSASLTPLQIANGFSAFANGGHRVYPYYLSTLKDSEDQIIFQANPAQACINCNTKEESEAPNSEPVSGDEALVPEQAQVIIEPRVNFIMDSILGDVITRGTGRRALALGRTDIRGKTGTTNDQFDAWFTGYNTEIVASVWVGFDSPQTLGRGEFGAVAALPIWLSFMEKALAGKEHKILPRPDKLVTVKINSVTGEAAKPGEDNAIFEIFREENAPQLSASQKNTSTKESDNEIDIQNLF